MVILQSCKVFSQVCIIIFFFGFAQNILLLSFMYLSSTNVVKPAVQLTYYLSEHVPLWQNIWTLTALWWSWHQTRKLLLASSVTNWVHTWCRCNKCTFVLNLAVDLICSSLISNSRSRMQVFLFLMSVQSAKPQKNEKELGLTQGHSGI